MSTDTMNVDIFRYLVAEQGSSKSCRSDRLIESALPLLQLQCAGVLCPLDDDAVSTDRDKNWVCYYFGLLLIYSSMTRPSGGYMAVSLLAY